MITIRTLHHIRLFYGAYFAAMGLILPYFPIYLSQQGLTAAQIGFLTGLLALAKMIAPPWIGHLLDAKSPRYVHRFTIATALCAALGAMMIGYSSALAWLTPTILLFGICWAVMLPITDALSITLSESRQGDYGRLRLWGSIGFIITSLAGGLWLLQAMQWLPLILALLMLIVALATRGFPRIHHRRQEQITPFPRSFYLLLLIGTLMQLSHGAYYGFFSLYLQAAGYNGLQIAIYWVLGVAAEVILMGYWNSRLQQYPLPLLLTSCLLLAALRWFGTGFTTHAILLVMLQLLHAASYAAFHLTTLAWVKRMAPIDRHSEAQGLFSAAGFGLGSTIGIMLCGVVTDMAGFPAAFYLCGAIALLAIPVVKALDRQMQHNP